MSSQSSIPTQLGGFAKAATRRLVTGLGFGLLLLASTTPLFAVADLPGAERGTLAAVFPPGTDRPAALAAVAEAGGFIVREGSWATVIVAHSNESGFAGRLRRAGAWLVVDPLSAAGCLIAGRITSEI
ncbi:MAG: hypothetical protein ACFCUT_15120 [Kiloniellaceae bacterium]